MSATEEVPTKSSPTWRRTLRKWTLRGLAFLGVLALVAAVLWSNAQEDQREAIAQQQADARGRVVTAALDKLKQDTRGAIALEGTIDGTQWKDGRIDFRLTIGNCPDVPGYAEVEQKPTDKSWAILHVLVAGVNDKTPPANVRVINAADLFQLKRTLNDHDSGLRHCVVGDTRLLPLNG